MEPISRFPSQDLPVALSKNQLTNAYNIIKKHPHLLESTIFISGAHYPILWYSIKRGLFEGSLPSSEKKSVSYPWLQFAIKIIQVNPSLNINEPENIKGQDFPTNLKMVLDYETFDEKPKLVSNLLLCGDTAFSEKLAEAQKNLNIELFSSGVDVFKKIFLISCPQEIKFEIAFNAMRAKYPHFPSEVIGDRIKKYILKNRFEAFHQLSKDQKFSESDREKLYLMKLMEKRFSMNGEDQSELIFEIIERYPKEDLNDTKELYLKIIDMCISMDLEEQSKLIFAIIERHPQEDFNGIKELYLRLIELNFSSKVEEQLKLVVEIIKRYSLNDRAITEELFSALIRINIIINKINDKTTKKLIHKIIKTYPLIDFQNLQIEANNSRDALIE